VKVALYGGTFDPVHCGHLIIAEEIRQRFTLDQVYFIPAAVPPHKNHQHITSPSDRFFMTTLAILPNPYFHASSVEIDRGGTSYTIETVSFFREQFGGEAELYFLMGVDAFLEISTWKNFRELLTLCKVIITSRPGLNLRSVRDDLPNILLNQHQGLRHDYYQLGTSAIEDHEHDLFFVEVPGIDISSTMIQQRASMKRSLRYLVPLPVGKYIEKYGLYSKGVKD
jgi:nicotinate-nucleotide adenylyltransferase